MDERQSIFLSPFSWILVAAFLFSLWMAIVSDEAWEQRWTLFFAPLLLALFMAGYLRTRLDQDQLVITYFPLWRRRIALRNIASATPSTYKWTEYGGWGIRLRRGRVGYSIRSGPSIRLTLNDSKRQVEFTTQRQEEWLQAFASLGIPEAEDHASPSQD